jgi:hypothetical protein
MSKETFEGVHQAPVSNTSESSAYAIGVTVRQEFRASVAAAAGVDVNNVVIHAVIEKGQKSRRLRTTVTVDRREFFFSIEVLFEVFKEGNTPPILPIHALNQQLVLRGLPQLTTMNQLSSLTVPEIDKSDSNAGSNSWIAIPVTLCSTVLCCGCIAAGYIYRRRSHADLEQGNPDVTVEVSLENYVGNQSFTDSFISMEESQIGAGDRNTSEKGQPQEQPLQPQQDLLRQEPTPFQEERAQISNQSVKAISPVANQQLPDTHAEQDELHRGDDEASAVNRPGGVKAMLTQLNNKYSDSHVKLPDGTVSGASTI